MMGTANYAKFTNYLLKKIFIDIVIKILYFML